MSNDLDELQAALAGKESTQPTMVATDLTCRRCGGELRGIAPHANCPSCGAPVGLSLYGDHLHFSDPRWLRTVRSGLVWMSLAMVAWWPALYAIRLMATTLISLNLPHTATLALALLVPIACSTWMALGAFKMTAMEPHGSDAISTAGLRRAVRAMSVLSGVAVPAFWLPVAANFVRTGDEPIEPPYWLSVTLRAGLLSVPVLIYASLAYLRTLARRIPSTALVRSTSIVLVGLPLSIIAVAFLPHGWDILRIFAFLAVFVFALWSLILIWIYSTSFDTSIRAARMNARRASQT